MKSPHALAAWVLLSTVLIHTEARSESVKLADPAGLTPAQIAEQTIPSVVLIRTPDSLGTGFAVADDRIATNLHVIRGAKEATIVLQDGRELQGVEVMGADLVNDLVVLRVPTHKLRPVQLGDSDGVKAGERVVAIGNPLGLGDTVSDGLVSAVREVTPTLKVLQISAPISRGSSGGPVLNDRGQVIGVSTLVAAEGQNLNFAMPINQLKPLLAKTKGTPIAEFKVPGVRERKVPHHELSMLAGCSRKELISIAQRIDGAIESGAPVYNQGSIEGCFHIYAAAALEIAGDKSQASCQGPRDALTAGLERASSLKSFDDKAWAMRDAFDGLINVVARATRGEGIASSSETLPAPPTRAVPHHPLSTLTGCTAEETSQVGTTLEGAINSGAPLYNQHNYEACFRIYSGAALELDSQLSHCPGIKAALDAGLQNAKESRTYVDKAWRMRDAFDGVLELLERSAAAKE